MDRWDADCQCCEENIINAFGSSEKEIYVCPQPKAPCFMNYIIVMNFTVQERLENMI